MGPYDGFHPMTVFTPCYTALKDGGHDQHPPAMKARESKAGDGAGASGQPPAKEKGDGSEADAAAKKSAMKQEREERQMRKELLETMARSNLMALQDRWAKKGDEEKKKGVASPDAAAKKSAKRAIPGDAAEQHPPAKKARESKARDGVENKGQSGHGKQLGAEAKEAKKKVRTQAQKSEAKEPGMSSGHGKQLEARATKVKEEMQTSQSEAKTPILIADSPSPAKAQAVGGLAVAPQNEEEQKQFEEYCRRQRVALKAFERRVGGEPEQQISPAASAVAGDSGTTAEASQRETSDNTEENSDNTCKCGEWKEACSQLCAECLASPTQQLLRDYYEEEKEKEKGKEKEKEKENATPEATPTLCCPPPTQGVGEEPEQAPYPFAGLGEPLDGNRRSDMCKQCGLQQAMCGCVRCGRRLCERCGYLGFGVCRACTQPPARRQGVGEEEVEENSDVTSSPEIQEDAQRLSSQPDDEVEEGEDDSCGLPGPLLAMSLSDVVDESEAKGVEAAEAIHAALMKWEHARESQICWDEVKDLVVMEHTRLQTLSPSEQQKQLERLEFTSLEEMLECVQEWEGGEQRPQEEEAEEEGEEEGEEEEEQDEVAAEERMGEPPFGRSRRTESQHPAVAALEEAADAT